MSNKRFRHLVDLQNPTIAQNEYNDSVATWTPAFAIRWGDLMPKGSSETINADQVKTMTAYTFTTYYDSTLDTYFNGDSRIVWGSRVFQLTGDPIIEEENTRKMITVDCVEVLPDG